MPLQADADPGMATTARKSFLSAPTVPGAGSRQVRKRQSLAESAGDAWKELKPKAWLVTAVTHLQQLRLQQPAQLLPFPAANEEPAQPEMGELVL